MATVERLRQVLQHMFHSRESQYRSLLQTGGLYREVLQPNFVLEGGNDHYRQVATKTVGISLFILDKLQITKAFNS